jgi:DHA2 family multidrug resistance protein-like MFS transporter
MLGVGLSALDTSIVNTALPAIAVDLKASPANSVWFVNAYQLAVVAAMLPLAALGDKWGPRRVFLLGLALFSSASLGCALANSASQLTVGRLIQGVGAAGIMSVNLALISAIFPPLRLGEGVGLNALIVGMGMALGPSVASLILAVTGWQWLFAINVPLGALALYFGRQFIPRVAHSQAAIDLRAAALTAVTFAALIFAIGSAGQRTEGYLIAIAVFVFLVCGTLLLRRQAGHPAPMLPVDLLQRPMFMLSVLTSICAFSVQGLAFVSLPFFFEGVLHRNAVQTGFLITPWAIATALSAPFAGRLSDDYPSGLLGGMGLCILCAGMLALAWLPADASEIEIVLRMVVCGIGFGFFQSPNLRAIMSSAPTHRRGGASGMIGLARLLGQTSGVALVALCLGLGGLEGARWALLLGASISAVGATISLSRLTVR